MNEKKDDSDEVKLDSLEHTDTRESLRQLWWTIAVLVIGLALIAFFTL